MKQNTNNCEMVQDLIPLYSEGLCSDVSRKIVKEHTASCENCRQLLTQIPADAVPDTPMLDESKPFRKVHKKMKKIRLRNVILSVALAAVVIPVGVLTVGEIIKVPFVPSFTTVMQSIEVRMMMKKLFSGGNSIKRPTVVIILLAAAACVIAPAKISPGRKPAKCSAAMLRRRLFRRLRWR